MIFILPLAGAVMARLRYREWWAWLVYASTILITLAVRLPHTPDDNLVLAGILTASAVGFATPELWQALRVQLRQPRSLAYLSGAAAAVFLYFNQQFFGLALAIGIIFYAWRYMLRRRR